MAAVGPETSEQCLCAASVGGNLICTPIEAGSRQDVALEIQNACCCKFRPPTTPLWSGRPAYLTPFIVQSLSDGTAQKDCTTDCPGNAGSSSGSTSSTAASAAGAGASGLANRALSGPAAEPDPRGVDVAGSDCRCSALGQISTVTLQARLLPTRSPPDKLPGIPARRRCCRSHPCWT